MEIETIVKITNNELEGIKGLKDYCENHFACEGCIFEVVCRKQINCALNTFMGEILERIENHL